MVCIALAQCRKVPRATRLRSRQLLRQQAAIGVEHIVQRKVAGPVLHGPGGQGLAQGERHGPAQRGMIADRHDPIFAKRREHLDDPGGRTGRDHLRARRQRFEHDIAGAFPARG